VGPTGRVVATDIDDDALDAVRAHARRVDNVTVRKAEPDEPGLEPAAYDVIWMSEMDHFLADRAAFLRKLRPSLAPNGRIAVTHVRALEAPLKAAAEQAGYVVTGELDSLPDHSLLFLQPQFFLDRMTSVERIYTMREADPSFSGEFATEDGLAVSALSRDTVARV
jgi:2-polyprenyl-3-methyl-5-hydroxy-6-metoxy-1,4-benzoquinol methylase